jgi:hypothetical protein
MFRTGHMFSGRKWAGRSIIGGLTRFAPPDFGPNPPPQRSEGRDPWQRTTVTPVKRHRCMARPFLASARLARRQARRASSPSQREPGSEKAGSGRGPEGSRKAPPALPSPRSRPRADAANRLVSQSEIRRSCRAAAMVLISLREELKMFELLMTASLAATVYGLIIGFAEA